jgi:lysophospholipase L1-like esterase
MLAVWCVAGAVQAADTPPPIPVVSKEAKALVPVPRDPNDQTVQGRTKLFNDQAQKGGFDVMFLGDSITHCWESFNPNNGEAVWKERIAPFNAVNFGIGGENTETLLWRLENGNLKGALDPKVIVLMIGTNNGFRDKPEEIAAGIGAILTRLHERLPKAKILLYGIFPRNHPGGEVAHKTSQEVNKILANYDGHWNIKYIDIGDWFMKPNGNLIEGVSWDGLHLTAKGYGIWADSLVTEFDAILKKKSPPVTRTGRLWDREPTLWDAARKYQIVRPLSPVLGWEGPRGGRGNIAAAGPDFAGPGKNGVNISNERLESSLWGTPDRLVLSLGKTDVWNRARLDPYQGKKPVGQVLLLAEDFVGAAQPPVSTSIHNGNNALRLTKGNATADIQMLLTGSDSNVIAIRAAYTNLTKPVALRLYRHQDADKVLPDPQSGSDGGYFWIQQTFAAEKTFPLGFEYFLVAKLAGSRAAAELTQMKPGLGAAVPTRNDAVPGSAATVKLPVAARRNVVVYATVVTRAEASDPLAEAKRRLAAAETLGYPGLMAQNEKRYQSLYERREKGRIFTGNIDDAKNVTLPFFYQADSQSRHTYNSNPDPEKFEGDANYSNLESDQVLWCGLQCFNEELYTPDYVACRDESVAPYYIKLFNLWRPACEAVAKARGFSGMLLLRGYVPPIKPDVYWSPDGPANNPQAPDWASMVWAFKNVWDAWDYGDRDSAFLRGKVYPCLRGIADFFAAKAVPGADGYGHIEPSQIREEDIGRDAIDCIAAAKWALRCASQAAQILGVDTDKRKTWQERLDKIAPYYVIQNDKGESVMASLVKDGEPVVAGNGTSHFVVNVADEINLESTEEQKQMAIRSNNFKHEQPMNRQVEYLLGKSPDTLWMGTAYPWICAFGHPAWMLYYAQKSGAGDFSRNLELKTKAQKTLACWLEPERLCNSRSGTIFFFPCVPNGLDIAFKDFQARGSFLVSAEYKAGKVTCARIKARRNGPCAVMNPWPGNSLKIQAQPGNAAVPAKQAPNGKVVFQAQAGTSYLLVP